MQAVDFSLREGEIHALMGENGAGKSTLIKVLTGVYEKDEGEIFLKGNDKAVAIHSPQDAQNLGISTVYQEITLCPNLSVAENMFIGRTKGRMQNWKKMNADADRILQSLDIPAKATQQLANCSIAIQQMVAIARAVDMDCKVLILDEPTSSLDDKEVQKLFGLMKDLRARGVGIIFVTHFLDQVYEVCDRITVLRDGNMVAAGPVAEVTTADLARFMVGHDVRTENLHQDKELGGEILRGEGLGDGAHFRDISFTVHAGEVLGVTGLLGDGRSELFQAVFGDLPYTGQLFMEGQPVKVTSTPQAIRLGIGYVPRNRKENGIIKDMDIVENGSMVTLPRLARRGLIDQRRRDAEFDRQVGELHIKMGKKTDLITSLSGGNQQKVVLAKWLSAHPKVLILDNPTQGVDVGAKEEIYDIILRLAREGVAVVVLSSEAQEIIRVCDRALVLYHGALQGEVSGADMNEQTIMHLATGGAAPSAQAIHTEE